MTMLTPTRDSSAGTGLAAGEYWIEFVPAAHAEPERDWFSLTANCSPIRTCGCTTPTSARRPAGGTEFLQDHHDKTRRSA